MTAIIGQPGFATKNVFYIAFHFVYNSGMHTVPHSLVRFSSGGTHNRAHETHCQILEHTLQATASLTHYWVACTQLSLPNIQCLALRCLHSPARPTNSASRLPPHAKLYNTHEAQSLCTVSYCGSLTLYNLTPWRIARLRYITRSLHNQKLDGGRGPARAGLACVRTHNHSTT